MSLNYDAKVIDLAKHMHEVACVDGICYEHPTHGKKLHGLHSAMTALSKLYRKSFDKVYEDVSDYAGWMSITSCIDEIDNLIDEPVAISF